MAMRAAAILGFLLAAAGGAGAQTEVPRALWQEIVVRAPAAAPAFVGDAICFVGLDRRIVCVDASTGKRRWRRNLPSPAALPPVEAGENLIVAMGEPEPGLIALDRERGNPRWSRRLDSRPAGLAEQNGSVVCATTKGSVAALDAGDGAVVWERRFDVDLVAIVDRGDLVVAAARLDSVWLIDAGSGAVERRWSIPGRRAAAPVGAGCGIVWASYDGTLAALGALNDEGAEQREVRAPQIGRIGAREGSIALAAAGGEIEAFTWPDLERLWIVETGETVSTGVQPGPTGWIVAAQSGAVRSYTFDRGSPAWGLEFRASISVPPAADGRRLCVVDDRGRAVVYELEAGEP